MHGLKAAIELFFRKDKHSISKLNTYNMNRLPLLLIATCLLVSINLYSQNQVAQVKKSDEAYKPRVQNLSIGNPAYAQLVLKAWKDFDSKNFENSLSMFADDVVATFPDGTAVKGKDNLFKMAKDFQGKYSAMTSDIHACTTLKSAESPGTEVAIIWGVSTATKTDGSIEKTNLHEVWYFNKDGKVTALYQYAAAVPKE